MAPSGTDFQALNEYLLTRSYIEGFNFSSADENVLSQLNAHPDPNQYPHLYRWFVHISALTLNRPCRVATTCPAAAASTSKPKAEEPKKEQKEQKKEGKKDKKENKQKKEETEKAPEPEKNADDFDDLFDDEEEQPVEEAPKKEKSRAEKLAEAKKEKEAQKKVERSQVVIEVKPWESDADLDALFQLITSTIKIDGLTWGEGYKKEPVAYGIFKLVISCVIIDDLVCLDDVTDPIQALEDHVQSVDVATMNRL